MQTTINSIFEQYSKIPDVEAIAIGGSISAKNSDESSDIDIYIFSKNDISIKDRENIILPISDNYEIGGEYFGSGDEFWVTDLNKQFDVMYWNMGWFDSIINNTWVKHYPQNGYTTCFLFTLKNFNIIYDKNNWLHNLQKQIDTPYPKKLKNNIIRRNLMLMKEKPFASYYNQIEKAIKRNDINSINHRISAFIASYFDIIFALNEQLHPGEKRLISFVKNNCKIIPNNFEENLEKLFTQPNKDTLMILDDIIRELKIICKDMY